MSLPLLRVFQATASSLLGYSSGLLAEFPVSAPMFPSYLYVVARGILLPSSANHVIPLFRLSGGFLAHSKSLNRLQAVWFTLHHTFRAFAFAVLIT